MSRNRRDQRVKRYKVVEHKGIFRRPVVEVDVTKLDFLSENVFVLQFDGSELDEPHLFGHLYLRFSDGLESLEFASKIDDFYVIQ